MMSNVWRMVHVMLVGLLTIPILWEKLHTYQKNRILCFLDYEADPNGVCWHTRQSIFAVGSGKVWGKGYTEGTQNQFDFLPEHWTDFPFSVWAEEWGFVGSAFVVALYGFLTVWILNVALTARDRAGTAICIGVAAMTFWHVVVNIAMVLGLAPVVGVTLPLADQLRRHLGDHVLDRHGPGRERVPAQARLLARVHALLTRGACRAHAAAGEGEPCRPRSPGSPSFSPPPPSPDLRRRTPRCSCSIRPPRRPWGRRRGATAGSTPRCRSATGACARSWRSRTATGG
jgi:hypothetical protein